MRRRYEEPTGPRERDALELIRRPGDGVWWQANDGMRIRLAGADGEKEPERERLSFLAVLIAMVVAGRARV
jgi:hypothetical protein